MRCFFLMPILLLASLAAAQTASQSDWSGGPGTPGPVVSWGDDFSIDTGCSWSATPGSVAIAATSVEHVIDDAFSSALCVRSSDIDGDGDVDVLGAAENADDICWWENVDGQGTSWIEHTIDGSFDGASSVHPDDIDGDGNVDVLGTGYNVSNVTWWENVDGSGTTWIEHTVDPFFDAAISVYSADVDLDGDRDVIGAAWADNDVAWWENVDGQGTTWIEHMIDGSFDGACSVYSNDIDGDGDIDVLGAGHLADDMCWWENADGHGTTWIEHTVDGAFDGASSVHSDDIDGDGDFDVLGTAYNVDDVAWWENADGTGTNWIEHMVDGSFDGASSVHSNDVDGDGDVDVLGTGHDADDVTWWENGDGQGTTWIEHTVDGSFDGARSIRSNDFDGDGGIDVLAAAYDGNDVTWWDLDAYPGDASLESSIIYTGDDPDWGTMLWTALTPPGTAASFQVRASDDCSQMGSWSDTLTAPCSLHGFLADNTSYFQYRAILITTDPETTPSLLDVTVTWNPLGIGEGEGSVTLELLPFSPNPTSGPITVSFGLPSATVACFSVFDVSGRVVAEEPAAEYPAGYQQIQLGELPPGIFICRMRAGGFTATQRFVVVD